MIKIYQKIDRLIEKLLGRKLNDCFLRSSQLLYPQVSKQINEMKFNNEDEIVLMCQNSLLSGPGILNVVRMGKNQITSNMLNLDVVKSYLIFDINNILIFCENVPKNNDIDKFTENEGSKCLRYLFAKIGNILEFDIKTCIVSYTCRMMYIEKARIKILWKITKKPRSSKEKIELLKKLLLEKDHLISKLDSSIILKNKNLYELKKQKKKLEIEIKKQLKEVKSNRNSRKKKDSSIDFAKGEKITLDIGDTPDVKEINIVTLDIGDTPDVSLDFSGGVICSSNVIIKKLKDGIDGASGGISIGGGGDRTIGGGGDRTIGGEDGSKNVIIKKLNDCIDGGKSSSKKGVGKGVFGVAKRGMGEATEYEGIRKGVFGVAADKFGKGKKSKGFSKGVFGIADQKEGIAIMNNDPDVVNRTRRLGGSSSRKKEPWVKKVTPRVRKTKVKETVPIVTEQPKKTKRMPHQAGVRKPVYDPVKKVQYNRGNKVLQAQYNRVDPVKQAGISIGGGGDRTIGGEDGSKKKPTLKEMSSLFKKNIEKKTDDDNNVIIDDEIFFRGKKKIDTVFMYPGQGSQYLNATQDLYNTYKVYKENVDKGIEILKKEHLIDISSFFTKKEAVKDINETEYAQLFLFIVEYSLTKLLENLGILPEVVIGHSLGEYTAACVAGLFSFKDGLKIIKERSKLMQKMEKGCMLSIVGSSVKVETILKEASLNDTASISMINSPNNCVVSGTIKSIEILERKLKEKDFDCSKIKTSHAFHSFMMEPMVKEFVEFLKKEITFNKITKKIVSNVTGDFIESTEMTDEYWGKHLRNCVKFSNGITNILEKNIGNIILCEIGTSNFLSGLQHSLSSNLKEKMDIITIFGSKENDNNNIDNVKKNINHITKLIKNVENSNNDGLDEEEKYKKISDRLKEENDNLKITYSNLLNSPKKGDDEDIKKKGEEEGRKVFVRGFPITTKIEHLKHHFKHCLNVEIFHDKNGKSMRMGIITFKTTREGKEAIYKYNQSHINSQRIYVTKFKPKKKIRRFKKDEDFGYKNRSSQKKMRNNNNRDDAISKQFGKKGINFKISNYTLSNFNRKRNKNRKKKGYISY